MVKMYGVGMLGSYLTQGVYAVASPFQPFGGAVDIIVVQQEDGTFKSSPWYVKFGDSQGALKSRERIVDISVNDVPAGFHMFLDNKGEAYFEKEVDANESGVFAPPHTSLLSDSQQNNNSASPEGIIQIQEGPELAESDACRSESPEHAEGMCNSDKERSEMLETSSSFAGDSRICEASVGNDELDPETASLEQRLLDQEGFNVGMGSEPTDGVSNIMEINKTLESEGGLLSSSADLDTNALSVGVDTDNLSEFLKNTGGVAGEETVVHLDNQRETSMEAEWTDDTCIIGLSLDDQASSAEILSSADNSLTVNLDSEVASLRVHDDNTDHGEAEMFISVDSNVVTLESIEVLESFNMVSEDIAACEIVESDTLNERDKFDTTEEMTIDNKLILPEKMELLEISSTDSCVNSASMDKIDFKQTECEPTICAIENPDITVNDGCTIEDRGEESSASERDVVYKMEEGLAADDTKDMNTKAVTVMPPSRWSLWPLSFRRSRTEKIPLSSSSMPKETILAATSVAMKSPYTEELLEKNGFYKPKVPTYVPTSSQLASLNLKEGPNKVSFTFPRGAGKTQVDARIYSWRWKTRIVISDVDGTITKSDVLGQVMPLVGRDWSQSGVTRLFSAIKDNGYEVLFLSARAISQAYLTRQFLLNLKQDGEALPEGPVFISPDGLIPSLYREVIRRAPHEFKISCLEGIRELFPKDINPFYAGFGNRITDEISYLKVGIPRGKIFIINPKGEVMVNHRVDTKSYTSIHGLVDDMFPPMSSWEQEDYNSWNFWKLPLPDIDIELDAKSSKAAKKGGSIKK